MAATPLTKADFSAGRMMPDVQILIEKITSQAKREKYAKVEGSVLFTEREKKAIGNFLSHLIGHSVILQCRVNPELLGGVRIQVGDWIVDTTLKYQLNRLSDVLLVY